MELAKVTANKYRGLINPSATLTVSGVKYPNNIFKDWTVEQLKVLGVFPVESVENIDFRMEKKVGIEVTFDPELGKVVKTSLKEDLTLEEVKAKAKLEVRKNLEERINQPSLYDNRYLIGSFEQERIIALGEAINAGTLEYPVTVPCLDGNNEFEHVELELSAVNARVAIETYLTYVTDLSNLCAETEEIIDTEENVSGVWSAYDTFVANLSLNGYEELAAQE